MAKSRQILNTIDTESKLEKQRAALLPKSGPSAEYLERMEEEKYKTESTKTHERYRRKQMAVGGADLSDLIRPAKEIKQKPGTYFYGTLEKLGKDFGNNIKEMTKHMRLSNHFIELAFPNFLGLDSGIEYFGPQIRILLKKVPMYSSPEVWEPRSG